MLSIRLVEEMGHNNISPQMLLAALIPKTSGVALRMLELGVEITDEVRRSLLHESGEEMRLIANPEGLVRWYRFDKLVQGKGETLRVGNCAGLVNPDVPFDDDHSLTTGARAKKSPVNEPHHAQKRSSDIFISQQRNLASHL